jgi:hypothetical protein
VRGSHLASLADLESTWTTTPDSDEDVERVGANPPCAGTLFPPKKQVKEEARDEEMRLAVIACQEGGDWRAVLHCALRMPVVKCIN